MPLPNHFRVFRPLRSGIYVVNPKTAEPGTLGLIATSDGADRWIISCYHVFCRTDLSAAPNGEAIHQPTVAAGAPIAFVDTQRSSSQKDFAAAKCHDAVLAISEILGIGALSKEAIPKVGMRVIKSGMASGVTEGVVRQIKGEDIVISRLSGFPVDYRLTEPGDSGAVWVELETHAPVAMNLGLGAVGSSGVRAISISTVLTGTGLTLL